MPQVGFEPTIPESKRAKTIHALDNSATLTSIPILSRGKNVYLTHIVQTEVPEAVSSGGKAAGG
jgi:hypothetical protein